MVKTFERRSQIRRIVFQSHGNQFAVLRGLMAFEHNRIAVIRQRINHRIAAHAQSKYMFSIDEHCGRHVNPVNRLSIRIGYGNWFACGDESEDGNSPATRNDRISVGGPKENDATAGAAFDFHVIEFF
jgi:hypothetical protein